MTRVRSVFPLAFAILVGCSSTRPVESPPAAGAPGPATAPAPVPAAAAPAAARSSVRTAALHPLDDPKHPLARRSVFFAFDSSQIDSADTPAIEAHAKYLGASRTARVRIEGHGDERGGREYNLALGRRRAEAVRKSLQLLGAPDGEMEAISFGKEKPLDPGHDEAAWARNRRADLNYQQR